MEFKSLYKKLIENRYYVFSSEDVLNLYPGEKRRNIKCLLSWWSKKGWVYRLKKGLYELTYPSDFNIPDMYVASRLYSPSYVSLQTALSYYNIIPEFAAGVTSVTTKPTRRFMNKHGSFVYRTIKRESFLGYYILNENIFDFFIAEPEKALVDFLYFNVRDKSIGTGRIDKAEVRRLNRGKLLKYANICRLDLKILYAYL